MLKLPVKYPIDDENIDLSEYAKKSDVDVISTSLDNKVDKKEVEKISSQLDNIETEIGGVKQNFKDDFNALNSEIEENKTLTDSEISKLKEIANTWEVFKNNGGDIGGAINFPFGATIDNITKPITISGNTMYYRENVTNNSGFSHLSRFEDDSLGGKVNQNGIEFRKNYGETSGSFRPMVDNALDLGSSNYKWKDIYLNGMNKNANGYTKLPNGLIMQWGYHHFLDKVNEGGFESTYSVRTPVSFPIAFPNKILSFSSTSERVAVFSSFSDVTNSSCTLFATSMANANISARIRWIAIGY